ncbi:heme/hemin ABC transporter substrate-binding protein [Yoonia vestfoldensis]|uniref:Hemin-binding periplasmic protein HmuT n=1 Tax=Yoonia vestfoldensis TaxID=245188 RepID=A0A1Y0ECN9_9RHOB|nr:ABC transporter substrate-binding protein [Yoonia vestfoldensis]ARU01210.1 hemin-binding periplasmic protein HmuT [Yoonia vestfoldensis]
MIRQIAASLAAVVVLAPAAFAETPSRVIAAGGSVAEIIHALGAGDRLIARDTTSSFPPEVAALPDIGYVRALSAENLIAMTPDLVIAEHDAGPPEVLELLQRSGIGLVMVPQALDPEGVMAKIATVATALDLPQAGAALQAQVAARLEQARAAGAALPAPPRVMFILSMQGGRLLVGGQGTSAEAMIALAGGTNAVTALEGYKPLTDEAAIAANPDLILMMDRGGDHAVTLADIAAHPALGLTDAAIHQHVVTMDGLYLLGFGPRTGDAALELNTHLRRLSDAVKG